MVIENSGTVFLTECYPSQDDLNTLKLQAEYIPFSFILVCGLNLWMYTETVLFFDNTKTMQKVYWAKSISWSNK